MDEFKRIKKSSLLILLLQFAGAAIGQGLLFLSVRAGDEATLPCNVIHDQDECGGTTWLFSGSTVELVKGGQISNHAHSDTLRLTENCSLVVKKVTEEDVGGYFCRQFRSDQQLGSDSQVYVSVVTMTEHQVNDEVKLRCSVMTRLGCRHTVKWLLPGRDVDKDNKDIKTSASDCSASVTFPTSHYGSTQRSELFTCEVTADGHNVQTFRPQSSAAATTTTTTSTTTRAAVTSSPTIKKTGLLRLVLVSVGLAALIMIVVAVNIWTRTKGAL
ncbi:uncharacterized protein [Pseudochaenichthys georgianus]|uniref:uncharacterized protein n=1 Tax=Pseudochaenichthys georgianus TaxID=52239 RepID=UPI00146EEFE4|nr:uncharacterized protein LOC117440263 [Pseudochaenichthys georgianus]